MACGLRGQVIPWPGAQSQLVSDLGEADEPVNQSSQEIQATLVGFGWRCLCVAIINTHKLCEKAKTARMLMPYAS